MGKRTLFGVCIEVLFIALGVYLIAANVIRMQSIRTFFPNYMINNPSETFEGWHDYETSPVVGFSWFFDNLNSFPAFTNLKSMVQDIIDHVPDFVGEVPEVMLDTLVYIAHMFFVPLRAIYSIIVDVCLIVGWFFNLFML